MSEPVVRLRNVGVDFGSVRVLADISLDVSPGEVIGIAGPNGAGKTTLLGVISTLIGPSSGDGAVFGTRLGTRDVYSVRSKIGWSGHDPGLYPELTLLENLQLTARLRGLDQSEAERALHIVGLTGAAQRRADQSSNGMQRRVDLARLVMINPELVLLDEAHSGLDEEADQIIVALLHRARSTGKSAVLVSHDAERLAKDADRVVQIDRGVGR